MSSPESRLLESTLLARIGEGEQGLGGAVGAALAAATAAALVERVARASGAEWTEASGAAAEARALRARLDALGSRNADAYVDALAAIRDRERAPADGLDHSLGAALRRAGEIPAAIAEICADVADLAADAAHRGSADLRADAAVSAMLADASARAMEHLVRINLTTLSNDPLCTAASAATRRAQAAAARAEAGSI